MANAIPLHSKPPMGGEVAPVEMSDKGSTNFLPLLAQEGDLGAVKETQEVAIDVPLKPKSEGTPAEIFTHRAVRVDH